MVRRTVGGSKGTRGERRPPDRDQHVALSVYQSWSYSSRPVYCIRSRGELTSCQLFIEDINHDRNYARVVPGLQVFLHTAFHNLTPPQAMETSGNRAKKPSEARRRAFNPFGDRYPDNDETKEVFLEADGLGISESDDRHVLLHWRNGNDERGTRYVQIIHLTGGPGNYQFLPEQVKAQSHASLERNTLYNLGSYSRAQRDQIAALAKAVEFSRKSRVNSCRTWMRDLLLEMVNNNLLALEKFDQVDKEVPLKKRVPEDTA